MSGTWFFIIVVHLALLVFGGTIWYNYKKYKNLI